MLAKKGLSEGGKEARTFSQGTDGPRGSKGSKSKDSGRIAHALGGVLSRVTHCGRKIEGGGEFGGEKKAGASRGKGGFFFFLQV